MPQAFLLSIVDNLALAGFLGLKWSLLSVPAWLAVQTISSIFSPEIQLGPNWQESITKMAVAGLRRDVDSYAVFHIIDTIIKVH